MTREVLYVFDVDAVPNVICTDREDAEHYRRLFRVGYRQVTFGVSEKTATNCVFLTFNERRAEDVAGAYGGEVIYIDWNRVPYRLSTRMFPYIVILPLEAKQVADRAVITTEYIRVKPVYATTELCESLSPVLYAVFRRMGKCEVDYTGKCQFVFRIGDCGFLPTRYESGSYVSPDEASVPLVAFGRFHLGVKVSREEPVDGVVSDPAEPLDDLFALLEQDWNRYYGYVEVSGKPFPDAVMCYRNADDQFVNLIY